MRGDTCRGRKPPVEPLAAVSARTSSPRLAWWGIPRQAYMFTAKRLKAETQHMPCVERWVTDEAMDGRSPEVKDSAFIVFLKHLP